MGRLTLPRLGGEEVGGRQRQRQWWWWWWRRRGSKLLLLAGSIHEASTRGIKFFNDRLEPKGGLQRQFPVVELMHSTIGRIGDDLVT